jgi:hypothetical protein
MSARAAVAAFAQRGARRGSAVTLLVCSGLLTVLLLLVGAWLAPGQREHDLLLVQQGVRGLDPSRWSTLALADVLALWVLAGVGFVIAPALVAATVGQERRAGTLDQLRTTPLSPVGLALGFVLGGPTKLYLLCAGPLGLHVVASLLGVVPLATLPASLVLLALGTVTSCLLALAAALATRQEAGGLQALVLAAGLGALFLTAGAMAAGMPTAKWAGIHPAGALSGLMAGAPSLWQRMVLDYEPATEHLAVLGVVPLVAVLQGSILAVVLLRAAARKLRAPGLPLLSKAQALTLFALVAASLVLPAYLGPRRAYDEMTAVPFGFLAMPLVVVLGGLCAPSAESWARALRAGARSRWHGDDAAPHLTMWLMVAGWLALVCLPVAPTLRLPKENDALALGWALVVAATLPIYVHFGATRFSTVGARTGFGVAVAVHLVCQTIAFCMVADGAHGDVATLFVAACACAGVAAPTWVALSQRALARRTRA